MPIATLMVSLMGLHAFISFRYLSTASSIRVVTLARRPLTFQPASFPNLQYFQPFKMVFSQPDRSSLRCFFWHFYLGNLCLTCLAFLFRHHPFGFSSCLFFWSSSHRFGLRKKRVHSYSCFPFISHGLLAPLQTPDRPEHLCSLVHSRTHSYPDCALLQLLYFWGLLF